MTYPRILIVAMTLVLAVGSAWAQSGSASGNADQDSNNDGLATAFESNWNSGDFDCRREASPTALQSPAVIVLRPKTGPCSSAEMVLTFQIQGDGFLDIDTHFDYTIACEGESARLINEIGLCPAPGPCTTVPLNTQGLQLLDLLVTSQVRDVSSSNVPALGFTTGLLLAIGVLAAGIWFIRRGA